MSKKTGKALPPKHQAWVEARRRHRLSHAHVQMARELGMNPKKLGSIDNHDQEPCGRDRAIVLRSGHGNSPPLSA